MSINRSSHLQLILTLIAALLASPAFAAFPTIDASQTSVTSSDNTSHTITLPSYSSGHLLVVVAVCDGAPTFTWPGGFTAGIADTASSSAVTVGVRYKVSDGTEGASLSFTTSSAQECAFLAMAITGYNTTTPLIGGATLTGSSTDPDPPNSNPGVAADYKWLSGFGHDQDDDTASYTSTSHTGIAQVESSATNASSCLLAAQYRDLNASSLNPAGMHASAEREAVAWTIAVNPGSGAPGGGGSYTPTDPFGEFGFFGM